MSSKMSLPVEVKLLPQLAIDTQGISEKATMKDREEMLAFVVGIENPDTASVLAGLSKYISDHVESWRDEDLIGYVVSIWDRDTGLFVERVNLHAFKKFLRHNRSTPHRLMSPNGRGSSGMRSPLIKDLKVSTAKEVDPSRFRGAKQLRSFVPKLLVNTLKDMAGGGQCDPKNMATFSKFLRVYVLLVDISGFTRLSGSFCSRGKAGIDDLQKATNGYMGKLVRVIYDHGGDIVKFAGDAIIVMFPADDSAAPFLQATNPQPYKENSEVHGAGEKEKATDMAKYAVAPIQCGLVLKDMVYKTLTVHVAISVGEVCFAALGGFRKKWENLISGACIFELSQCLDDAPSGQMVVTKDVIQSIGLSEYFLTLETTELVSGNVKVLSTEAKLLPIKELKSGVNTPTSDSSASRQDSGRMARIELMTEGSITDYSGETSLRTDDGICSTALGMFVPLPVSTYIQNDVFNYLAELRLVTTVFMKWDGYDAVTHRDLLNLQEPFLAAQTIIETAGGFIRQFLVDDKGCVLIACWGVPTSVYLDNADRALSSAIKVHDALNAMSMKCSFGITTGSVYCGCVGSNQRQEYAAIGDVVNMAARLMGKAKGGIYVDEPTTKYLSPALLLSLVKLDPIMVKGKEQPINVFSHQQLTEESTLEVGQVNEVLANEKYVRPACKDFIRQQIKQLQLADNEQQLLSGCSVNGSTHASSSSTHTLGDEALFPNVSSTQSSGGKMGELSVSTTFAHISAIKPDTVVKTQLARISRFSTKSSNASDLFNACPIRYVIVEGSVGSGKATMVKWICKYTQSMNVKTASLRLIDRDAMLDYGVIANLFRALIGGDKVFNDLVKQKNEVCRILEKVYGSDTETAIVVGLTTMKLVLGVDKDMDVKDRIVLKVLEKEHNALPTNLKMQAILAIFEVLLSEHSAVITIENVHFADDSSLKALFGFRNFSKAQALFVMTACYPEDIMSLFEESGDGYQNFESSFTTCVKFTDLLWLSMYRSMLMRLKNILLLDLVDYEVSDIEGILLEFYPNISSAPCHKLAVLCHQVSGGNPFWLGELIGYITNAGVGNFLKMAVSLERAVAYNAKQDQVRPAELLPLKNRMSLKGTDAPMTEQQMNILEVFVICRYEQLSPDEQMTLRTIAVIGFVFHTSVCQAILSKHLSETLSLTMKKLIKLNWAIKLNWVSDTTKQSEFTLNEYRFGHPLFQKVLYNMTPPSERVYIHQAIAEFLTSLEDLTPTLCLSISHHFSFCDEDRSADYRIKAAEMTLMETSHGVDQCIDILATNSFIDKLNDIDSLENIILILSSATYHVRARIVELAASDDRSALKSATHRGSSDNNNNNTLSGKERSVTDRISSMIRSSKHDVVPEQEHQSKPKVCFTRFMCFSSNVVEPERSRKNVQAGSIERSNSGDESSNSMNSIKSAAFQASFTVKAGDILLMKINNMQKSATHRIEKLKKEQAHTQDASVSMSMSLFSIISRGNRARASSSSNTSNGNNNNNNNSSSNERRRVASSGSSHDSWGSGDRHLSQLQRPPQREVQVDAQSRSVTDKAILLDSNQTTRLPDSPRKASR